MIRGKLLIDNQPVHEQVYDESESAIKDLLARTFRYREAKKVTIELERL